VEGKEPVEDKEPVQEKDHGRDLHPLGPRDHQQEAKDHRRKEAGVAFQLGGRSSSWSKRSESCLYIWLSCLRASQD